MVEALAPQHAKDEVKRTIMRLSVTGRLVETKHKYSLTPLRRILALRGEDPTRIRPTFATSFAVFSEAGPEPNQLADNALI